MKRLDEAVPHRTGLRPRTLLRLGLIPTALLICLLVALGTAQGAPDTVTVTTTTDEVNGDTSSIAALISTPGGDGISLREAVIAANNTPGMDEIILPSGIYTLTIEGSGEDLAATGDLDVTDDLTITGAGASTTIIDAGGMTADPDRVFHLGAGASYYVNAAISDVTITNGDAGDSHDGGGVWHRSYFGTLALTRCTITNNSGYDGGGIAAYGELNLLGSTISGNTANDNGGGLYAADPTTIADSTISDNSAVGQGGGIYADDNVTVTDTTISGNSSLAGGGLALWYGSGSLDNTTITGNSSSGYIGVGGGIVSWSSTLVLTNSDISENSASDGGAGIFTSDGAMTLVNCTVTGNTSQWNSGGINNGGDGILEVIDSTVAENVCRLRGAGIANWDQGTVTITGSSVNNNSANHLPNTESLGGGIFNAGGLVDVDTTTISDNWADAGGGIFTTKNLTVANSTILSLIHI